jgi:long-chain acyl-CoA synthetase
MDDIFTISYTSGTEKNSKGVMLSNKNFIAGVTNILRVGQDYEVCQEDTYISYLPLAHVFDRLGIYSAIAKGAAVGFYGGETLKIMEDLALLKPTIFPSVPRLLNKVYDKVMIGLEQKSKISRALFNKGIQSKLFYLE